MTLKLGKSFDRNYNMRFNFLRGYYDVGVFLNKKSTFLLFSIDSNLKDTNIAGIQVNMFKNLESSKFCETFLELHNFRKNTLDILNQFKTIKPEYYHEVSFITNETVYLSKVEIDDKRTLFDSLNIYAFTLNSFINEFIFIITERQNIVKKLNKKIVRTSGVQIATSRAINMLNEYHDESLVSGRAGTEIRFPSNEVIHLNEEDDGD